MSYTPLKDSLEQYDGYDIIQPNYISTRLLSWSNTDEFYSQFVPWIVQYDKNEDFFTKDNKMYQPVYENFELGLALMDVNTPSDGFCSVHLKCVEADGINPHTIALTVFVHKPVNGVSLVECLFFETYNYEKVTKELRQGFETVNTNYH